MRRSLMILTVMFSLVCTAAEKPAPENVGGAEWKARMHAMLDSVLQLFPFAFNDAKFADPKNKVAIEESMTALLKHADDLKAHASKLKNDKIQKIDPSFPFIADAFESELAHAQSAFNEGAGGYAQSQAYLRAALSKCTMCHSQSKVGPELKLNEFNTQIDSLPVNDKLTALAMTRQFDTALKEYVEYARSSKVTKPETSGFDKNTRLALAIAIRVKNNPKETLKVVDAALAAESGSTILQHNLRSWKAAVTNWQSEKSLESKSDDLLFQHAQTLITAAKAKSKSSSSYEDQSVWYLRASADLHELLSNFPKSKFRGESYILLSSLYESLPGFAMWDLSDEYLGACIKENPHTVLAEKCAALYEESVTLGYTGSSGTHLPSSVKQYLKEMKELAHH